MAYSRTRSLSWAERVSNKGVRLDPKDSFHRAVQSSMLCPHEEYDIKAGKLRPSVDFKPDNPDESPFGMPLGEGYSGLSEISVNRRGVTSYNVLEAWGVIPRGGRDSVLVFPINRFFSISSLTVVYALSRNALIAHSRVDNPPLPQVFEESHCGILSVANSQLEQVEKDIVIALVNELARDGLVSVIEDGVPRIL